MATRIGKALESLEDLRDRRVIATAQVDQLAPIADVEVPGDEFFAEAQTLQTQVAELQGIQTQRERVVGRIERMKGVEDVELDVDTDTADKLLEARTVLEGLRVRRSKVLDRIAADETELESAETELKQLEDSVRSMLGGLEACPVCGNAGCDEVLQ